MCNIDADENAIISPDSGVWSAPQGDELISNNAGAAMGTVQVGGNGASSATMQLVGTVSSEVKSMSVEVPEIGTVTATIDHGFYSIFIPNSMLGSSSEPWMATITRTDGTVVRQKLQDGMQVNVSGS